MRIIKPSFDIEDSLNGEEILSKIEKAGRTCYKSEDRITKASARQFVQKLLKNHHESVIEHVCITVRIICDRGVSHEIVRHRIASYSQESTRYCNYGMDAFGNEITVIEPCFWKRGSDKWNTWERAMQVAEKSYFDLINAGATPQEARSILPSSLKTEIVVTYNLREWRHFFKIRTAIGAHPQMREIAVPMLRLFQQSVPILFGDIVVA